MRIFESENISENLINVALKWALSYTQKSACGLSSPVNAQLKYKVLKTFKADFKVESKKLEIKSQKTKGRNTELYRS